MGRSHAVIKAAKPIPQRINPVSRFLQIRRAPKMPKPKKRVAAKVRSAFHLRFRFNHAILLIQFEFLFPIYILRKLLLLFVEYEILHHQIIHLRSHKAGKCVFR